MPTTLGTTIPSMITVHIVLAEDDLTTRPVIFHGGDCVSGHADIHTVLSGSLFAHISLEGATQIWLNTGGGTSDVVYATAEHQGSRDADFLKETLEVSINNSSHLARLSHDVYKYRIPFEFVLPRQLISAHADLPDEFLNLPPSTKAGRAIYTNGKRAHMQPLIFYTIKVVMFIPGTMLPLPGPSERDIIVMPIMQAAPPVQLEDYPGEYTPRCSKAAKRHAWSRSMGQLSLSVAEPLAMNIATSAPRASTVAFVKLLFQPSSQVVSTNHLSQWHLTIRSFIRIKTFLTARKFTTIPRLATASKDRLLQVHLENTKPEARQFTSLSWRLDRLSPGETTAASDQCLPWTTTLPLPVNGPKSLLPTFLSPLAAVRYALVIQVSLAGACHEVLELEVPIQVINDPSSIAGQAREFAREESIAEDLYSSLSTGLMAVTFGDEAETRDRGEGDPPPYTR